MFYEKSLAPHLDAALFEHPTSEFRSAPFWAWNGSLDPDELTRQMDIFRQMGFGGYHMHVRTGLTDPYLTDSFMDKIRLCVEKARHDQQKAYLYDEDRWPSGSAGGKVTTDHPEYARRTLLFTTNPYDPDTTRAKREPEPGRGQQNMRQENGYLLAVYDVTQDEAGYLTKINRVPLNTISFSSQYNWNTEALQESASLQKENVWDTDASDAEITDTITRWYAYVESATADPWFNNGAYVDTLNPEAIRCFLDYTHEAYARDFQADFGGVIPSIFTDEPQFAPKQPLSFAKEKADVFFPWTDKLPALYLERYGEDLLDYLPELVFEVGKEQEAFSEIDNSTSGLGATATHYLTTRWQYQNLVTDRFVESFVKQIGDWCQEHGLELTGHVMSEPTLNSQSEAVGDAMRCYPDFGIPGIDMLCDFHEYTTAKQAQSMVRQQGKRGMLSELYGVTGWDYDFRGYKLQGDWQAALGVTLRVPHLSWLSMHGEAKRDYPASISYQSPWYTKYHLIEDHFARLNTALTRGKPLCRVAVIHPIESYWLLFGPNDQTLSKRIAMERHFLSMTEGLLLNGIDFDFLNEASLPAQVEAGIQRQEEQPDQERERGDFPQGKTFLSVGAMDYDVIVIPPVLTLRQTTVEILADFVRRGGKVLVQGEEPALINARKVETADKLHSIYLQAESIGSDMETLLTALEPYRFLGVQMENGQCYDRLVYQLRQDKGGKWLFIANGVNPVSPDVDPAPGLKFTLDGEYEISEYNTQTGEIMPVANAFSRGKTSFERTWYEHDSLLLWLEEEAAAAERTVGETVADASVEKGSGTDSKLLKETGRVKPEPESFNKTISRSSSVTDLWKSMSPDLSFGKVPVTLEEPNMLLLDLAEYSMNGRDWYAEEEILRIDNIARKELGIPPRRKEVAQPYTISASEPKDTLKLRFRFTAMNSDGQTFVEMKEGLQSIAAVDETVEEAARIQWLTGMHLAMENPEVTRLWVNGTEVPCQDDGYFVDKCIRTIPLPPLKTGVNLLEVQVPIGEKTDLEDYYLLGSFTAALKGTDKVIAPPAFQLGWGDITRQGLPFYTGTLVYHVTVESAGDGFDVRVPQYRGGLAEVLLDGEPVGNIVGSPYVLHVAAAAGRHEVGIRLYGTRQNGFAQVHHSQGVYFYQSPNSWRSTGDLWTYEYQLKPAGILKSPEFYGAKVVQENGQIRRTAQTDRIIEQS